MRWLVVGLWLGLSGCLSVSHRAGAVPSAFDDVPLTRVADDEVRSCSFLLFNAAAIGGTRSGKAHHDADVVNLLESKGAHAGIVVESTTRVTPFGTHRCTWASGRRVPLEHLSFEEE